MHRKPKEELLTLDRELEKTLRNMRKVKNTKSTIMAKQRVILRPIPEDSVAERPQR